jgi:hypothetical protein
LELVIDGDIDFGLVSAQIALNELGNSTVGFDNDAITLSSWTSLFGQEMLSQFGITSLSSDGYSQDNGYRAVIMDGLVKSIYFTILADLGQDGPSNALASPTEVKKFANETYKLLKFSGSKDYGPNGAVPGINAEWTYNTPIPDFYNRNGHTTRLASDNQCAIPLSGPEA